MVEFGEQLRRAREEKGLTQQSLAEQLYVTRQSVSRWECGDRYPDLLTTKKISQILEVSLDDLLSEKEMKIVVERNPVIEKKSVNNIMIALYACVVFSIFVTIVDMIIRFPLQSEAIDYSAIHLIVIEVLGLLIQIVFFAYGFFQAIRGTLSPKRMGAVVIAFFGAMCLTESKNWIILTRWQWVIVSVLLIFPSLIGAAASFLFYIRGNCSQLCIGTIYTVSIWGMFRILYTNYQLIANASRYLSMNNTINMVLRIAIYGLIIYQTYTLKMKRKAVVESYKADWIPCRFL